MNQFSISQLAQFSGVKPHTIRIWEQRYNALHPKRSEGNTRYYDGDQLRRLLNIVSLTKTNFKVSQLCSMNDEELFQLLEKHYGKAAEDNDYDYFVNLLLATGMDYDEPAFDKIFSHCLLRFGLAKTYEKVVSPLLAKLGLMWTTNVAPPSQEHFLCNLIRQKLFTAIDSLPPPNEEAEKWLLFLPENELHEIGLLFSNYLIRSKRRNTVYLGTNTPLFAAEKTLIDLKIDKILIFLVHKDLPENVEEYLKQLKELGKEQKIYIAANKELFAEDIAKHDFEWLHSVQDLERGIYQEAKLIQKN